MKRPTVNFVPEAWLEIDKVKFHPKNPRIDLKTNQEKFDSLKKSIEEGVFEPIKISKLSGFCISGNQRLAAYKELGYEEIPVQYNEYENEKDEIRDMIKDNNSWGAYDQDILNSQINEFDLDMLTLGLEDDNIDDIIKEKPIKEEKEVEFKSMFQVVLDCENESDQEKIFQKLTDLGYKPKILSI